MRILVTNDDGVYSPGIAALAEVAARFGQTRIVAPHVEMSSAAHSITASRPLTYKRTPLRDAQVEAYRVNGTPADCVALGMYHWEKVDVVLSGINLGSNLGNALWHSGTLAAAQQAALLGVRGIAVSTPVPEGEPDFEVLKPWAARVLELLLPAKDLCLVNVNLPAKAPRGVLWTRQSVRHYDGKVVPGKDPMGRTNYWFTVVPIEAVEEGTDRWAIEQGYVSMTPLRLDLTDEKALTEVARQHPVSKISFAAAYEPSPVGAGAACGASSRPAATDEPGDQRSDEQHQEDEEQNLRDRSRAGGDASEPEDRRDDRDDEKHKSVVKHRSSFPS